MRVVLLVEKPSMAKRLAPFVAAKWPKAALQVVCVSPIGVYRAPLPRGLGWADYPYIAPFDIDRFLLNPQSFFKGWEWKAEEGLLQNSWDNAPEEAQAWLQGADTIVTIYSGDELFQFEVACRKLMEKGVLETTRVHRLLSFDDAAIVKALDEPGSLESMVAHDCLEEGRVRHYFHHQFACNSVTVLRRTAQGLTRSSSPWISKYQLQLVQAMAGEAPLKESEWILRMQSWKGTGRYPIAEGEWSPGLGSAMSRAQILGQVEDHGWCTRSATRPAVVSITPTGEAFVRRLHPDCWDPDLPFRLAQWASQGLTQCKPSIDRYVRTFFGKQKRFLDQGRQR